MNNMDSRKRIYQYIFQAIVTYWQLRAAPMHSLPRSPYVQIDMKANFATGERADHDGHTFSPPTERVTIAGHLGDGFRCYVPT